VGLSVQYFVDTFVAGFTRWVLIAVRKVRCELFDITVTVLWADGHIICTFWRQQTTCTSQSSKTWVGVCDEKWKDCDLK